MNELETQNRLRSLERRLLLLTGLCCLLAVSLVLVVELHARTAFAADASPAILHVKGLVIEDAQGRARILLGAPFPQTHDRLRQDETSTAIVFLDEKGHDRFLVGETITAQIDGKVPAQFHRIGQSSSYAATIFDPDGNERGGMGFLSNGSSVSRAVVALDRPGADAIGMMVDDKTGYAGLGADYAPDVAKWTTGLFMGTQGKKAFITVKDLRDIPRATFGIGPESHPSFQLFDEKGNPGTDLLNTNNGNAVR
jgi:hypothetical protein